MTAASGQAQAAPQAQAKSEPGSRAEQARQLVRRNVYWALGAGLIPVPVVDLVAQTGVQVKMIKELSDLYQVKFFEDRARTIVGALIAGLGSISFATLIARSVIKTLPVIGTVAGAVSGSIIGGALTLAIGNLFTMHFESGGTLLTFDADKMRAYFKQEFEKAKGSVSKMQSEPKSGGDQGAP